MCVSKFNVNTMYVHIPSEMGPSLLSDLVSNCIYELLISRKLSNNKDENVHSKKENKINK